MYSDKWPGTNRWKTQGIKEEIHDLLEQNINQIARSDIKNNTWRL